MNLYFLIDFLTFKHWFWPPDFFRFLKKCFKLPKSQIRDPNQENHFKLVIQIKVWIKHWTRGFVMIDPFDVRLSQILGNIWVFCISLFATWLFLFSISIKFPKRKNSKHNTWIDTMWSYKIVQSNNSNICFV